LRKGITAEGDVLDLDPIAVGGGGAANHEAPAWAIAQERWPFDREEEGDTSRHEIGGESGGGGVDERAVLSYGPWARRGLGGVTGGTESTMPTCWAVPSLRALSSPSLRTTCASWPLVAPIAHLRACHRCRRPIPRHCPLLLVPANDENNAQRRS
jgi:hypothetical protein